MTKNKGLNEDVTPSMFTDNFLVDVRNPSVRDNINIVLSRALHASCITPYVGLNKVSKALAYFHIMVPKTPFLEGERGVHIFNIEQFGHKSGAKNDGDIVTKIDDMYSLYFEWELDDQGMFKIFSEVVTNEELEDLLDAVEDQINDEDEINESTEWAQRFGDRHNELSDKLADLHTNPFRKAIKTYLDLAEKKFKDDPEAAEMHLRRAEKIYDRSHGKNVDEDVKNDILGIVKGLSDRAKAGVSAAVPEKSAEINSKIDKVSSDIQQKAPEVIDKASDMLSKFNKQVQMKESKILSKRKK